MIRLLERIEVSCSAIGRAASWTIPFLIVIVCVTVIMAYFKVSSLLSWETHLPVFNKQLNLSALTDLQWHLFAVLIMLGGVYALHDNSHVSVDFFSSRFSNKTKNIVLILGDLLLLLPFALVMAYFSVKYVSVAFDSGEGSSYGGLSDRWIVKSCMPLGFILLSVYALSRAVKNTLKLKEIKE